MNLNFHHIIEKLDENSNLWGFMAAIWGVTAPFIDALTKIGQLISVICAAFLGLAAVFLFFKHKKWRNGNSNEQ